MNSENIFLMVKENYEIVFKDFEHFHKHDQKRLEMLADKYGNPKLEKNYNEWFDDTRKAFKDYKYLIISGLEYLSGILKDGELKCDFKKAA